MSEELETMRELGPWGSWTFLRIASLKQQLAECRRNTLLEAADYVTRTSEEVYGVALVEHIEVADELRRMAEKE